MNFFVVLMDWWHATFSIRGELIVEVINLGVWVNASENCSLCSLCWDNNFLFKILFPRKLVYTKVVGDLVTCALQKFHDFISSSLEDINF